MTLLIKSHDPPSSGVEMKSSVKNQDFLNVRFFHPIHYRLELNSRFIEFFGLQLPE